jgi:hypothetical protein
MTQSHFKFLVLALEIKQAYDMHTHTKTFDGMIGLLADMKNRL